MICYRLSCYIPILCLFLGGGGAAKEFGLKAKALLFGQSRLSFRISQIAATVTLASLSAISVNAVNLGEWDDRNRLAAQVWRTVDEVYIDRSFNGQDWFKLREDVVKKEYKSDEELYEAISAMLTKLGDKYTRFLAPAQYTALRSVALGEAAGIGVELDAAAGTNTNANINTNRNTLTAVPPAQLSSGSVVIERVEPDSSADRAGLKGGDLVMNVDGTDTSHLSVEEVSQLLR